MKLAPYLVLAGVATGLMAVGDAGARPFRPAQVPNGAVLSCALCHVDPRGGGPRNVFGQMVEADFLTVSGFSGNVVWGPELAALDADGDGATNGEELLDPEGTWSPGDPDPGDPDQITRPWDPDSAPPPAPTAVAGASWARVKAVAAERAE